MFFAIPDCHSSLRSLIPSIINKIQIQHHPNNHENSLIHNDHYMFPYNPHGNYRYSHDYNRQYRLTNSCFHNRKYTDFDNFADNFESKECHNQIGKCLHNLDHNLCRKLLCKCYDNLLGILYKHFYSFQYKRYRVLSKKHYKTEVPLQYHTHLPTKTLATSNHPI